ncbi:DUF6716 putative glycosyltransferase [uncultured Jatrophihabitans sp.]|uniref:DUF6716 putative glycosyltransferase n=1 Tax=uncultured Jatrophihabitans sp. TaxID=1610747 RepID=UPI0035CC74A8
MSSAVPANVAATLVVMNSAELGSTTTWDVHVVADSDTRWKWGASLAHQLTGAGTSRVHGHLVDGRAAPTDAQVREVGVAAVTLTRGGMSDVLNRLADVEAEVVVLACAGGTIQSLLHGLAHAWQGRQSRPVVVTGYVGVVYERVVDGLLLRAGADVVLANSAADERTFRSVYRAVGADPDSVVRTALPFLGSRRGTPAGDRPFTVTFVAQPSVPETAQERRYAMTQVLEHARRHPERHVVVKLRARPGEQTTHVETHHYATLVREASLPANVSYAYGSMADVLDRTDLCVTVSSTAALEAMHRNIPVGVLTDFGVRESLGNHVFAASGALVSWPELHDGVLPTTDPTWAADNGVGDDDAYEAVRDRLLRLTAQHDTLPPLRPWFTTEKSGAYLPHLLARHGLDPDGSTPAGRIEHQPHRGRRVLRGAARRVHRLGTARIEPRLRRWANQ